MTLEPADGFTTRDAIAQQQIERLPALATRMKLHLRPKQALDAATQMDAIELAAAEVVESGREFAELSEDERRVIFKRSYAYCVERNARFLYTLEMQN